MTTREDTDTIATMIHADLLKRNLGMICEIQLAAKLLGRNHAQLVLADQPCDDFHELLARCFELEQVRFIKDLMP